MTASEVRNKSHAPEEFAENKTFFDPGFFNLVRAAATGLSLASSVFCLLYSVFCILSSVFCLLGSAFYLIISKGKSCVDTCFDNVSVTTICST